MKIKNIVRIAVILPLALSTFMVISIQSAAAAAPYPCTWAGGEMTGDFNNGTNWQNCNGSTPSPSDADAMTFPFNNGTSTNFTPINNLTSAVFGSLTFSGTLNGNNNAYDLKGNALTLTNAGSPEGIVNSGSSGATAVIETPITFSNAQDIVVNGTQNSVTLSGSLSGVGAISLSGGGSLHLTGNNSSYSGAIHDNGGVLFLDNNNSASAVSVASGSTLKGDGGSALSINVASGGTIAPGHSPGCLTTGSLVVNGTYQEDIAGTTACSGYDQVVNGGSTDITGATLTVNLLGGFQPTAGTAFTILKNTGGGAITGTFAGLPEGSSFTAGGISFSITYKGNGENDVVLTVNKTASSAGASSSKAAPGAPDTGLMLITARPITALVVSVSAALIIVVAVRRYGHS